MATKEKQPDIEIHLRTDRKEPESVTPPPPAQFPIVLGDAEDFVSDQDSTVRQYEMNEFNDMAKSSLLRMNEKGDIESMVKPILEGQEPVMQRIDDFRAELNPTINMLLEHFIGLGAKVETDPTLAGQAKRTLSLPGQAVESAVRNSLKFFVENVLPDDVQ